MKNIVLGLALALTPLAAVTGLVAMPAYAIAAQQALGDLVSMHAIVADSLSSAMAGDLKTAGTRITDFESAWDKAEPGLRPRDTASWTAIDHVADTAIQSLRVPSPSKDTVVPALEKLLAALDAPTPAANAAAPAKVAFSLTNADGSPVPCEVALEELRRVSATTAPAAADAKKFQELQAKGIERCNADDDKRADNFFGQALALLTH